MGFSMTFYYDFALFHIFPAENGEEVSDIFTYVNGRF